MTPSSGVVLARLLARSRLRQWQLVAEIAALGSVQRGAAAVGMSQPAATQAVNELEQQLGFAVFERHAKGTRLTPAGEAVLPRIRQAMTAFAECAEVVSDLLAGGSAELRVGGIGAAVGGILGSAVATFSRAHPRVMVHVRQRPPAQLVSAIGEGTLELALIRQPSQVPAQTQFEPLVQDRYAVVCSPRHAFAGRHDITREELAGALWLPPPKSAMAERDFQALWQDAEPPRQLCWVESRALVLVCALVEQRQALAMIPFEAVRSWLQAGMLAEVPCPWAPRLEPIGALFRPDETDPRSPRAELLAHLRQQAAQHLSALPMAGRSIRLDAAQPDAHTPANSIGDQPLPQ